MTARIAPVSAAPPGACRRLCREAMGQCDAAAAACLVGTPERHTKRMCRRDRRLCARTPFADCMRARKEPVVEENENLSSCPLTPAAACSGLRADQECADPLHPADRFFWDTLHAGEYQRIPEVLERLQTALGDHPGNPSLTRHVAWANIWRLGELARGTATGAELQESLAVTRPTFDLAHRMEPNDPRILGFLGSITFVEGVLFGDRARIDEGSALLVESIHAWPEFNYFTAGYVVNLLPRESAEFQQGLEFQWKNLDVCMGEVVDRRRPHFQRLRRRETYRGRQRACWNSWIAPFNFEGFFLNMGDMLVRNGEWRTAVLIYEAAKLSDTYQHWPYRSVIETRIDNAEANVDVFNRTPPVAGHTVMFRSSYSCVACHQAR